VRGLPGVDRRPARAAHKLAKPARVQRPLGVWSTRGSAHGSLDSRRCSHIAPPWHDRPQVPSGRMTGRCSPIASWLTHAPTRQENTGGRASEQDGDVVADLTDAQWRCRAALVVEETGPASGSFSEVDGCSGTCTRGWKTGEVARHRWSDRTEARRDRGGLPKGGSCGGADKMNGRVFFYRASTWTDRTTRPWQLALDRAMSAARARAGADGAASGCCDSLTWRQHVHGVVL
jgi:hypothetical protein